MNAFKHKFFGWLEADARRWVNPDGSEGGIVACDASVPADCNVLSDAVIGPRESIGGGASIGPRASIEAGDWFQTVGPIGSGNAMALAVYNKQHGLRWWSGCQHGIRTDTLRERIRETHGDNEHAKDYLAVIAYVESHPGLSMAMAARVTS